MTMVRVSHSSSSSGVFSTTGLAENDRRGLELWEADFGSRRSGAATVRMEMINVDQFVLSLQEALPVNNVSLSLIVSRQESLALL